MDALSFTDNELPRPGVSQPHMGALILLADDEPGIRTVVQAALEEHGYRVLAAATGEAALDLFRQHRDEVRAVLLDMRMPELDGAAVLCVLRQEAPELPVILVSGLLEPRRREALLAAGARLFLAKPYTDEQLLEALHRVLPPRA